MCLLAKVNIYICCRIVKPHQFIIMVPLKKTSSRPQNSNPVSIDNSNKTSWPPEQIMKMSHIFKKWTTSRTFVFVVVSTICLGTYLSNILEMKSEFYREMSKINDIVNQIFVNDSLFNVTSNGNKIV